MSLFAARNLAFSRNDRYLFRDLEFDLDPGQVLQVEGHNGAGKTTLLRILCGLTLPAEGEILWDGENIRNILTDFNTELAYVGHLAGLKEDLTPYENLEVTWSFVRRREGIEPIDALDRVKLPPGHEDNPVRTLSAGQRRRVALARLLLSDAKLWIIDEPFTALDRDGRRLVEELVSEHAGNGGMAVLTTHHSVDLEGCSVVNLQVGK